MMFDLMFGLMQSAIVKRCFSSHLLGMHPQGVI